jgi:hypothetical protein
MPPYKHKGIGFASRKRSLSTEHLTWYLARFVILRAVAQNTNHSTPSLLLRSLLPSDVSATLCVLFGSCFIGLHLLLLSLNAGTFLPTVMNGEWGLLYTNHVVQPLETVLNNLTFSNMLVICLWGVAGLAVYFLVEYSVRLGGAWSHVRNDIQITNTGQIVRHPMQGSFFRVVAWRMSVLVVGTVLFILAQSTLQRLLAADSYVVLGRLSVHAAVFKLSLELLGWAVFAHGVVVFLRLFLMRTRLFGDSAIA